MKEKKYVMVKKTVQL